jgi:hypothetical protein
MAAAAAGVGVVAAWSFVTGSSDLGPMVLTALGASGSLLALSHWFRGWRFVPVGLVAGFASAQTVAVLVEDVSGFEGLFWFGVLGAANGVSVGLFFCGLLNSEGRRP